MIRKTVENSVESVQKHHFSPQKWLKNHYEDIILHPAVKIKGLFPCREKKFGKFSGRELLIIDKSGFGFSRFVKNFA